MSTRTSSNLSFLTALLILLNVACSSQRSPVYYNVASSELDSTLVFDAEVQQLIEPYTLGIQDEMNRVIGRFEHDMFKKKPEGELGNFMCDAALFIANKSYDANADLCIMNYGGIRTQHVPAGDVTVEQMFEIMPFENELVVLTMTGSGLLEFFQRIARSRGWPISKEVELQIANGELLSSLVNGEEVDKDRRYRILLSDYVANGGDQMSFLRDVPRDDYQVKLRDAMIEYVEYNTAQGNEINAGITKRIINAE